MLFGDYKIIMSNKTSVATQVAINSRFSLKCKPPSCVFYNWREKGVTDPTASRMFSIYRGVIKQMDEPNDGGFMTKHKQVVISRWSR